MAQQIVIMLWGLYDDATFEHPSISFTSNYRERPRFTKNSHSSAVQQMCLLQRDVQDPVKNKPQNIVNMSSSNDKCSSQWTSSFLKRAYKYVLCWSSKSVLTLKGRL